MGVIRWVNRVDPEVWSRACDRLVSEPPKTGAEAEQFLKSFGRDPDPYLLGGFEDLRGEPELESPILNGLLEAATKEQSWELDRSLSHGLEQLPGWLPELGALREIIDFSGLGVEPPSSCTPGRRRLDHPGGTARPSPRDLVEHTGARCPLGMTSRRDGVREPR